MVDCPACGKTVSDINLHLDSSCKTHIVSSPPSTESTSFEKDVPVASLFRTPLKKNTVPSGAPNTDQPIFLSSSPRIDGKKTLSKRSPNKRSAADQSVEDDTEQTSFESRGDAEGELPAKRLKLSTALQNVAPLAERMRPQKLDDIYGQELVGPDGLLRGLIEAGRVPSMILWGGAGTGKTTIARAIANEAGSRFVEISSTSSGVGECKKIFAEARLELGLSGRKTIIFCDEIHRFSKSQQEVFLGPVESGQITLIGAMSENPSFKVQSTLLSRCRTFTLKQLTDEDVTSILQRALDIEGPFALIDNDFLKYLAAFSEGDARTALNLLEMAMDISSRPSATQASIKSALTRTLVYDRAGDQHYDSISALHKSIRGSDPDAALYYLARMFQSGESPLYIARRLIVIASEDIGLADNTLLPLCTAAHASAEKLGMPEARISLAHATVALALAPKSTRVHRALEAAVAALDVPGVANIPVPSHLRNAPTRLMKEMGMGKEYKYNPLYRGGKCRQEYLPRELKGRVFLEEADLGDLVDEDEDGGGDGGGRGKEKERDKERGKREVTVKRE